MARVKYTLIHDHIKVTDSSNIKTLKPDNTIKPLFNICKKNLHWPQKKSWGMYSAPVKYVNDIFIIDVSNLWYQHCPLTTTTVNCMSRRVQWFVIKCFMVHHFLFPVHWFCTIMIYNVFYIQTVLQKHTVSSEQHWCNRIIMKQ